MRFRQPLHRICAALGGLVLLGSVWAAFASAATYYVAPTGADSHAGTSADTPWQTFAFAIPRLQPGDTLILRDGTYTGSTSGYPDIDCRAGAHNGTASQPITLKAENERQASIHGTGTANSFRMRSCTYWTIQGLQMRSADANVSYYVPDVVDIQDSSHLILRRLLVHHNNRYLNDSLFLLLRTSASLVEESEFYYFHRHAILTKFGSANIFRRNYFNSRGSADIPGGWVSGAPDRGDSGISIYPGSNHLLENNISEGNSAAWDIMAIEPSDNNRILGQISLNDNYGGIPKARGDSSSTMPHNTTIQDFVVVNPKKVGVYARSAQNTTCLNCSVFGGPDGLTADGDSYYPGDGTYSFYAENALVVKNTGVGIKMVDQSDWQIDYPNAYNNTTNFYPNAGVPQITHARMIDPVLGSCKVFIPAGSPMKGAGKGGADIGANVLYRYQNGMLTTQPLWEGPTGMFPCGAVVTGVNDDPGDSCRGVHQRLSVNANGCTLPSRDDLPSRLPSPVNFRLVP